MSRRRLYMPMPLSLARLLMPPPRADDFAMPLPPVLMPLMLPRAYDDVLRHAASCRLIDLMLPTPC